MMDKVDQPLRFVKFEMKRINGRYNQILIITSCMDMKLETLFKMIRGRWDIENSIFNNMKSECAMCQKALKLYIGSPSQYFCVGLPTNSFRLLDTLGALLCAWRSRG